MRRVSLLLSVVIVLAALCVPVRGATIQGSVLEAKAPHNPLSRDGRVTLYKKSGTEWVYASGASVDETDTTFAFSGLAAGAYSLFVTGDDYVSEYYNNTTLEGERTEIPLAADDTYDAGDIYLRDLPIRLDNPALSSHSVPASGGTVSATVDVVNDTTAEKTVLVRAVLTAMRTAFNATYIRTMHQCGSKTVTVPAHTTVSTTVSIVIPGSASPDVDYNVQLHLGLDKWRPLSDSLYAGYIAKLR
ncbi:hypothetical protein [Syntrophobacter fumaroxidans]|uniref:Uncharacterized protein n=1 Tax=Syntrophobacter fumaroxidans (strain DSM 10017 / MPOB) TaxID=335543 RepID=A0LG10_SYNFM|nr:hypothetical protein [Syntrophobacter fumaroxidans]ABK16362.1 hypothetical protein Sfum_0663 [Syntrophobacter fumaroxidans MPOB]